MTVVDSNSFYWRQEVASDQEINLAVQNQAGQILPDGHYQYELYAVPLLSPAQQEAVTAVRATDDPTGFDYFVADLLYRRRA